MSVEAITWALAQPVDRSSSKFVLVVLANYANADMCAWPSIAAICAATSQNRKTVMDGLRRLLGAGLIVQTGETAGRTGSVPVYQLDTKAVPKTVQLKAAAVPKTGPHFTYKQCQKRDRFDMWKQYRKRTEAVPKTDGSSTENGTRILKDTKGHEKRAVSFSKFWAAYPNKKSKGAAEKAWQSLKPSEQLEAEIHSGLERAKTSPQWTRNDGQFIPHPATWLRAKGWEDEFAPAQQPQGAPRFIAV